MRTLPWLWVCALALGVNACGDDDEGGTSRNGGRRDLDGGGAVCTTDGACEEALDVPPALHMQGSIDYPDKPPAGGPHNPCWGSYGVHQTTLPVENWVHNLEHGAVVYLHRCPGGCVDDIAILADIAKDRPFAIVTPYADMTTRFAVVAWGYRLQTDAIDRAAFEAFYAEHVDSAPESISSGPPSGCP